MEQATIEYLDKAACIARANMAWRQRTRPQECSTDEAGAVLLVSCHPELHDQWRNKAAEVIPSPRILIAARTCVAMRKTLEGGPRSLWSDEEQGYFS